MGQKQGPSGPAAEFPTVCVFIRGPWVRLKEVHKWQGDVLPWWQSNTLLRSPSCLPPYRLMHTPPSSSQALILLASPQARRGVRVGSICLCDGHWCQAPRGLEGEERRLVWSRRVTDVSELSSGTLNGAESWGWSWGWGEEMGWESGIGIRGLEERGLRMEG